MSGESVSDRQYVRHPTDVPIEWSLGDVAIQGSEYLKNVSHGGLAFVSVSALPLGAVVNINIPLVDPQVVLRGIVVWCAADSGNQFEVGVRFVDESNHFAMRMVEQICHIEHFKREIFEREGRELTGEEAALVWINQYAKDFPS